MYFLAPPIVINVVFVCPLRIAIVWFLLKTLRQNTHFSLHSLHFLFSTVLCEVKRISFQSKPRTLEISSLSMASSSSVPESTTQEIAQGTSTQQETPAYEIKGRTMSLEEWELTVQVQSPVDFASLAYHGCNIKEF